MTPEAYYRQILETTSNGILVISRACEILEINRNAMAMFNIDDVRAIGKPIADVLPDGPREALIRIVEETFDEGFALNEEIAYWEETGIEIELGISGSLIVSDTGQPLATVICRDMTAKRELERLRKMDQLKSDYVNKVAHELRNPLTTIQAYSETAASMIEGEPKEFLGTVEDECNRMLSLIKEMLNISRLESGKLKLTLSEVDFGALVVQCVEQVRSHSDQHTLSLDSPAQLPKAKIDEDKIKEVVLNLLENAVKYSPEGGEIRVVVTAQDQMLSIAVSDCGIGIESEHLRHLFEKFYRVDSPGTRGIPGTGLGLAITKGIVDAHAGSIQVDSEVGQGTTFTVELPAVPATTQAPSNREP